VHIVSKGTNANTITHYLDAPLKAVRRSERDLTEKFPNADVTVQGLALVSVIGRDLNGLNATQAGLAALQAAQITPLAVQHLPGSVDIQFLVAKDDRDKAIKTLHRALIEKPAAGGSQPIRLERKAPPTQAPETEFQLSNAS